MKTIKKITTVALVTLLLVATSCKKDKKDPDTTPSPNPPANDEELITTFKLLLTDSATNTTYTYMFKDPDGDGGQAAFYGPSSTTQTDSVLTLAANTTFYGQIVLLDETKSPVDTVSNEVEKEGDEHMFFYNNGANSILNSGNPYSVQLNGSAIKVTYTDLDAGTPQRGIGLQTKWRTASSTGATKYPLNITLKHQPTSKDGTFAPGESDISVDFKIKIN